MYKQVDGLLGEDESGNGDGTWNTEWTRGHVSPSL